MTVWVENSQTFGFPNMKNEAHENKSLRFGKTHLIDTINLLHIHVIYEADESKHSRSISSGTSSLLHLSVTTRPNHRVVPVACVWGQHTAHRSALFMSAPNKTIFRLK